MMTRRELDGGNDGVGAGNSFRFIWEEAFELVLLFAYDIYPLHELLLALLARGTMKRTELQSGGSNGQ